MDIQQYKIDIPDITDIILSTRSHTPGVKCSSKGGFQDYFYKDPPEWVVPVIDQVRELFPDYRIFDAWFNVNGPGHSNRWHRHHIDEFSAVVYVQVPEDSGYIEFQNGRKFFKIMPEAGDVIAFSSNVMHRVLENKSNDHRISIAFNLIRA